MSYEVGSASNTSYHIYQYIDGYNPKITFLSSEDTKVETKRIKDSGTVILVSGKLSSYTDTITITYDYDKKLLDKEMPTMDSSYINWINEYPWDTLGGNDILTISGESDEVKLLSYESVYSYDIMLQYDVLFTGILLLWNISIIIKTKETESTAYLRKYVESLKSNPWYNEKDKIAEPLFQKYHNSRFLSRVIIVMIVLILYHAYYRIALNYPELDEFVLLFTLICTYVLGCLSIRYQRRMYESIVDLLINQCDPYSEILASSKFMYIKRGTLYAKNYNYRMNIAIAMSWAGDAKEALVYGELIWNESKISKKIPLSILQYHHLRLSCFSQLGFLEELEKEEHIIGELIKKYQRFKRKKAAEDVLVMYNIKKAMNDESYEEAKALILDRLSKKTYKYLKVYYSYLLWTIYEKLNLPEEGALYKAYALKHGNELFFMKNLKEEP